MTARLIALAFGCVWLIVGVRALVPPASLIAGLAGCLLLVGAVVRIAGRARKDYRFDRFRYLGAVAAEFIAIMLAQHFLPPDRRESLLLPLIGVIVGLHFIGLWLASGKRRFVALAAAMTAINLIAMLPGLPAPARAMISGFGSSAALLLSAAA